MIIEAFRNLLRWVTTVLLNMMPFLRRRVDLQLITAPSVPGVIKIYPSLRGFDSVLRETAQQKLDKFHEEVNPVLRRTVANNIYYGVHLRKTPYGDGVFNGTDIIPVDTVIAFYIAAISTDAKYKSDRDTTYGFSIGRMFNIKVVLDGRFHISPKKPYNGNMFNHHCAPNFIVWSKKEPKTGIKYLEFISERDIEPGEQLFIDYNYRVAEGNEDRLEAYWSPIENLAHVPEWAIRRCGCGSPCPKRRAYDLRLRRPDEAAAILAAM
jgi:hypothetical protein